MKGFNRQKEHVLDVQNLVVSYHSGITAVRGISFFVNPGEIVGIAGESGSGKSTAMLAVSPLRRDCGKRLPSGSGTEYCHDLPGFPELPESHADSGTADCRDSQKPEKMQQEGSLRPGGRTS